MLQKWMEEDGMVYLHMQYLCGPVCRMKGEREGERAKIKIENKEDREQRGCWHVFYMEVVSCLCAPVCACVQQ